MQKHYGSLKKRKPPRSEALPRENTQSAERVMTVEAPTPTEKLLLGYRAPAFSHPDTAAHVLTSELLFGGRSTRLHRSFCIDREIALSVRGSLSPFVEPGLFEIWIFVRHGCRRQEALTLLDEELDRLAAQGPTAVELSKAAAQLELSFLHSMETAGGKAEQIGFYETVANDGAAVFERLADYREVTANDVQRVTQTYLRRSRRTRVEIVPSA